MAAKAGRVAKAATVGKAAKRPIGGLYVGTRLLHNVGLLLLKNHDVILAIRIPQIKKPRFLKKIKGNRERIPVMKIPQHLTSFFGCPRNPLHEILRTCVTR